MFLLSKSNITFTQLHLSVYIANRIALSKHKSFSSFITKLSIAATALSVATMIVALAILYGFNASITNKIYNCWGHIRVRSYTPIQNGITDDDYVLSNDTLEKNIRQLPSVKTIQSYATKSTLVSSGSAFDALLIKGVPANYDSTNFGLYIKQGRWMHYNDSTFSKEIIISTHLANDLQLSLGSKLNLYFLNKETEKTRAKNVTVVGIYKTDMDEFDNNYIIGDLNLIRNINYWDSTQIGGYEIYLNNTEDIEKTNNLINEKLGSTLQSRTIYSEYPNVFDWLRLLDTNKYLLLIIIGVVATINLITFLIVLVLERIKMIGVLKSLGNSNGAIQQIFIYHTLLIGTIGTIIGALLGLLLCYIQQQYQLLTFSNTEAYSLSVIPIQVLWWHVPLVCLGTLLICSIMLSIPALLIKKISPTSALKY